MDPGSLNSLMYLLVLEAHFSFNTAFFCEIGYDRKPIDDGARFIVRILFNDVPSDAEFRIATSLDTVMEISEVHLARANGRDVVNE